ncbi:MAG TPA: ABC transporter ATP-binding protein [Acidimicrobiales bacterium]|nr:ABC transporter ATP-binding protein [Acidimicrobiales bacterium]
MAAITVKGLRKSYGDNEAVRGIDLEVTDGEVFALLGPNGAGKTTTVEILEGYRHADAGEVSVLGLDPARNAPALRARIGIVLQSTGIDQYLTVRETLSMYAHYFEHPRQVDELIEIVGLEEKRDSRVTSLSGGQQRRLDLAVGLVGDPELLFLDEPTTGFDPSARREAWQMVRNLTALGKTVLLTTHYMDEAQYLARRVAVMARGRIVAEGSPDSLARHGGDARVRFRVPDGLEAPFGAASDGVVEVVATDLARTLHEVTTWALANKVNLDSLDVLRPSLEDVYLRLVGEAAS